MEPTIGSADEMLKGLPLTITLLIRHQVEKIIELKGTLAEANKAHTGTKSERDALLVELRKLLGWAESRTHRPAQLLYLLREDHPLRTAAELIERMEAR